MTDFYNERSKFDIGYFELLGKIDAVLVAPTERNFDEMYRRLGCRAYWIRHDVDEHIEKSWEMAKAESERGIKAAYFFLNTAPYFRWGVFLKIAKDFIKAGHTIGLHNNCVASAYKHGNPSDAEKIMTRDLGYLRQAGEVFITASHGDAWNRHHNVMNYEMFTECKRTGVFPHKPMAHYGLKYEAYFTPRDFYLSDSGGVWSSVRDINVSLSKDIPNGSSPLPIIDNFNATKSGIMQLLVHPEWWELKP